MARRAVPVELLLPALAAAFTADSVFCFPPLKDTVLYTIASILRAAGARDATILVPNWPSKLYLSELLQMATSMRQLRFKARQAASTHKELRQPWEWLLLRFQRRPPSQRDLL